MERTNTSVGRREHGNGRCLLEEAFGRGNIEVVDGVLHCDFVCYDPDSEAGEISGADNIKRGRVLLHCRFDDPHLQGGGPSSRRRQGGEQLHRERHARGRIPRRSLIGEQGSEYG
jgi:hypothetical protein